MGTHGADISRQARIEELRQMVAAGQYQVQPQKLALKILVRALRRN
jgi:anti-sigma28 factor (negative regulator of flagellin synthesis)